MAYSAQARDVVRSRAGIRSKPTCSTVSVPYQSAMARLIHTKKIARALIPEVIASRGCGQGYRRRSKSRSLATSSRASTRAAASRAAAGTH